MKLEADSLDLSVVIPSLHEAHNLAELLPSLTEALEDLGISFEILVVDGDSGDGTQAVAEAADARYICERERGYGPAIMRGVGEARGAYVVTMDADLSHPAEFVAGLWAARAEAKVVIASRYVEGGRADQPWLRLTLSRVLNGVFGRFMDVDVRDMTSGFRLYDKSVFRTFEMTFSNFAILVEILLHVFRKGKRITETPFHYRPRGAGRSNARILHFGLDYLRLLHRVWGMRNSIGFPDYDWRAFDSRIPLQRYWQRRRCRIVLNFCPDDALVVDVGCGSSRILAGLPRAVGVDLRIDKLLFMRRTKHPLVQADGCALPMADGAFPVVVCSEVIEHIPDEGGRLLDELDRVLAPGGILIIGTPDYGNWQWRWIEHVYNAVAPGAYGDEHVTRYTFESLRDRLSERGYEVLDHAYILRGELIVKARKGG